MNQWPNYVRGDATVTGMRNNRAEILLILHEMISFVAMEAVQCMLNGRDYARKLMRNEEARYKKNPSGLTFCIAHCCIVENMSPKYRKLTT